MPCVDVIAYLTEHPYKLVPFFNRGVVLDTGMLLLYLVGLFDKSNNSNFLREFGYTKKDFAALTRFLELMKINTFVVTPHILTEFYSLTKNSIKSEAWSRFLDLCMHNLLKFKEIHIEKDEILQHRRFKRLGFCDVGIKLICKKEHCNAMMTDDRDLHTVCKEADLMTIPFGDIKAYYDMCR